MKDMFVLAYESPSLDAWSASIDRLVDLVSQAAAMYFQFLTIL